MHIVITGGGTGGHIFPALEIIKNFKKNYKNLDITYVGNKNNLEEKLAHANNIKFYGLTSKKLAGQNLLKKLISLFYLVINIFICIKFILKNKTKKIIGVGGYISAPMIIAGFILRKDCYIAEQNLIPGLANKYLAFMCKKIFTSFPQSNKYFPTKKITLTGNPVRREFFSNFNKPRTQELKILTIGGTQGSEYINNNMLKTINILSNKQANLYITHQTGSKDLAKIKNLYNKNKIRSQVIDFIKDMPEVMKNHDLVISRSGATTCAEICALGIPAVLIPYPHAGNHQRYNAQALVNNQAAIMVEQGEDFVRHLAQVILELYQDPNKLFSLSQQAKLLARPHAAKDICAQVLDYDD